MTGREDRNCRVKMMEAMANGAHSPRIEIAKFRKDAIDSAQNEIGLDSNWNDAKIQIAHTSAQPHLVEI